MMRHTRESTACVCVASAPTASSSSAAASRSRRIPALRRRRARAFTAFAFATAALCSSSTAQAQSITATPAADQSGAGSTLSPVLSPSYAGVGIEPVHLFDYIGSNTVNQLSFNVLSTLANYTGVPPHLRIGGNSGDNIIYKSDAQYDGYEIYRNPAPTGQGALPTDADIIGPGYFRVMDMLPKGTPVTYGLNMAYNGPDALSQVVNQAAAPMQILKNATIVGFELGNEPDLYVQNNYRPSGWGATEFGNEWAMRVKAVYQSVLQTRGMPSNFFEPPCTATTATSNGRQYRISNIVNTGIAADNGIYVAGWNQHDYYYYVGVSTYTLTLPMLLDTAMLVTQMNEWRGQADQAKVTGKPYYLREMGSVGPTGLAGITDVFGNTLWTLNVFLYSATIQISSVQIHMTSNSYASPWQPIPMFGQQPHVRTTYYAFAAMAQIIGKGCTTRVAAVPMNNVPSAYQRNTVMYAVYQFGSLRSVVMMNTKAAYAGQTSGSLDFVVTFPASMAGQQVHLSTLSAPGVDSTAGTTWNGISYETSSDGTPTVVDATDHTLLIGGDGTVTVPVRDGQAVVAALQSRLGDEQDVDTSACAALGANPEGGENTGSTQSVAGVTGTAPVFSASPQPTFASTAGFSSGAAGTGAMTGIVSAAVAVGVPAIGIVALLWM